MRIMLAAISMAAMAGSAFAETAQPTVAAAPAAAAAAPAYVSTCPRSALAPKPNIPDPKTVTNSGIAKANTAYTAWNKGITAFVACKDRELKAADAEFEAAQAKSPALKMVADYNAVAGDIEKAVAAYKTAGFGEPHLTQKPPAANADCGPAPAAAPAPIPSTPAAEMKKGDVKAVQKAFDTWLTPRYIYIKCSEPKVNAEVTKTNEVTAPYKAKHEAIVADYEQVKVTDREVQDAWKQFGVDYKARLKAGGG